MKKEFFIRTKGKDEFKTYHLICLDNFNTLDVFFNSEIETKQYAVQKSLTIVVYKDIFEAK